MNKLTPVKNEAEVLACLGDAMTAIACLTTHGHDPEPQEPPKSLRSPLSIVCPVCDAPMASKCIGVHRYHYRRTSEAWRKYAAARDDFRRARRAWAARRRNARTMSEIVDDAVKVIVKAIHGQTRALIVAELLGKEWGTQGMMVERLNVNASWVDRIVTIAER